MLRKGLFTLFLLFISLTSFAKTHFCRSQNLNNLVLAQWGGFWEKKKETGFYRVLVYRVGWEHAQDVVQFQVMRRDERHHRIRIKHCVEFQDDSSRPPVIKGLQIRDNTRVQANITLQFQQSPLSGNERTRDFLLTTNGKLTEQK